MPPYPPVVLLGCIFPTHESESLFFSWCRYMVVCLEECNSSWTACLISWRLSVGWFPVALWPHASVSWVSSCWCLRSKYPGLSLFHLFYVGVSNSVKIHFINHSLILKFPWGDLLHEPKILDNGSAGEVNYLFILGFFFFLATQMHAPSSIWNSLQQTICQLAPKAMVLHRSWLGSRTSCTL